MVHKEHKMMMSPAKAKKMMKEGMANGKELTAKQKGFFGIIASGKTPRKMKK